MRPLAILILLLASCPGQQIPSAQQDDSYYPESGSIMGHALTEGAKDYQDHGWAIHFRHISSISGDWGFVDYEVTVSRAKRLYKYKLKATHGGENSISIRRWNDEPPFKVGEQVKINPKWGDCPKDELTRIVLSVEPCETCATDWHVTTEPSMSNHENGNPDAYDSEWFVSLTPKSNATWSSLTFDSTPNP